MSTYNLILRLFATEILMSARYISMIVLFFAVTRVQALQFDKGQVTLDKLDDYNLCQTRDNDGSFCHDALLRWIDKHPADAFKAGKMTRLKMNAPNAVPFFATAWEKGKGDCKDEDVKLAVLGALALPADNTVVIAQAKKIGLEKCSAELGATIVDAAKSNDYTLQNICKDLIAKKLLTGVSAKRCKTN